MHMHFSSI